MFTVSDSHRALARRHGTLVARIFMGALFIVAGYGKIATFAMVAGYIESVGLPAGQVLAALTIVLEIGAGLMLVLGYRVPTAAAALAAFTIVATLIFHNPSLWAEDASQQLMFLKNIAIVGGLLYMVGYGAGDGWTVKRG